MPIPQDIKAPQQKSPETVISGVVQYDGLKMKTNSMGMVVLKCLKHDGMYNKGEVYGADPVSARKLVKNGNAELVSPVEPEDDAPKADVDLHAVKRSARSSKETKADPGA